MTTALLITTNEKFKEIEFEENLDFFYKHIECDLIDIVTLKALERMDRDCEKYLLVVDDEGLLKNNPKLNIFATAFSGRYIYGNAMIVKDDGEHFAGLTTEDHRTLSGAIKKLLEKMEAQYCK